MPRKTLIADLKAASELSIPAISQVTRGDDDGAIWATFTPDSGAPIEIELMIQPDVGSYPTESFYMIFTRSAIVPDGVGDVLSSVAETSAGLNVADVLTSISSKLQRHLAREIIDDSQLIDTDDDIMDVDLEEQESEEETDDEFYGASDQEDFDFNDVRTSGIPLMSNIKLNPESAAKLNQRIKEDLRVLRFSGFKIGILVGMRPESVTNILSISIQIAKLGLSDEAMQAWDLEAAQYIVLLIRYSNGYKSFDAIMDDAARSSDVSFRIGVSNRYKPLIQEATAAFSEATKELKRSQSQEGDSLEVNGATSEAGFSTIFISSSLNELINSRFISLLKIRHAHGIGWDGAKRFFNDNEGRMNHSDELDEEYFKEPTPTTTALPDIVTSDHLTDPQVKQISLPLISMQFALRYLTRCTEFCLVCHDRIKDDFEALKPYVCEKPLCLYQYMNLGFGPSVEHEILNQPYVVDLLISFCYLAAMSRRIREYPIGMSLAVPRVLSNITINTTRTHFAGPSTMDPEPKVVPVEDCFVKYDPSRDEIIFESSKDACPVRVGDWVAVTSATSQFHHRVEDTSYYPTVHLSHEPMVRGKTTVAEVFSKTVTTTPETPTETPPPASLTVAKFTIYNNNFDEMDDISKAETIAVLIETMPSIKEMRTYLLKQSRLSEPSLRSWNKRISPAALGMLRWIIASNRSCIVQVDKCPGQDEIDFASTKVRLDQRVSNISTDWVQFRFAQGSPDKEQRFLNALREHESSLNLSYPTLFAFHGSPLGNWHSIIRTGLDFKETLHGRAFGHGVYHSQDQNTSVGYAHSNVVTWQGSELQICSAMSLNEIVNIPANYASRSPHLVVQHIDWIQCRYLFVQVQKESYTATNSRWNRIPTSGEVSQSVTPRSPPCNSADIFREPGTIEEVPQDPSYQAKSTVHKVIGVPLCAASVSRAFLELKEDMNATKRRKSSRSSNQFTNTREEASDCEDPEDLAFLLSDDESSQAPASTSAALIDFVPGSLKKSELPMLQEPEYATPMATQTLSRAFRDILELQAKTPLHELGWFVDADLNGDNLYQWIVELHSFDPTLPLSKDMKLAGVSSIVLEILFPKDYPFSPPFLRVVRPRFLPFTMGGGGHVTGGGAMCMELLTSDGWSAVSTIDSVLLQVRLAMSNLEPKPARLQGLGETQTQSDYTVGEAIAAYIRACNAHGWKIPESFREFASGAGSFTDFF